MTWFPLFSAKFQRMATKQQTQKREAQNSQNASLNKLKTPVQDKK